MKTFRNISYISERTGHVSHISFRTERTSLTKTSLDIVLDIVQNPKVYTENTFQRLFNK